MAVYKREITISVILSTYNHPEWLQKVLWGYKVKTYKNYGGQGRGLGKMLVNFGIKQILLRYSTLLVHLNHKRGYKTQASIHKNRAIRKVTKNSKSTFTPYGVVKSNEG
ncbi:MAG TPA: hypothetical protein VFM79_04460 [Pelobium sp.]|nr:hypothetical protein [Pelobium sp.]